MSDDWAKNYIGIHQQKQQEQQNRQRRADLARAAAPDMFQRIKKRIRQDLQTFYDASVLQSLSLREESSTKFVVIHPSPSVKLEVELDMLFIKYQRILYRDDAAQKLERDSGTLRICSDLQGNLSVYDNGTRFVDESDVSQFLLQPVLDHIDQ